MSDLEIMESFCGKCVYKTKCHRPCLVVWSAIIEKERRTDE